MNPSSRWIHRLNRRQRKKLYLGEFRELALEMQLTFAQPLEEAQLDALVDGFVALAETRKLIVTGFGGALPLTDTEVFVCRHGRGSVNAEDVAALQGWLQARAEMRSVEAGRLVDAWYGF